MGIEAENYVDLGHEEAELQVFRPNLLLIKTQNALNIFVSQDSLIVHPQLEQHVPLDELKVDLLKGTHVHFELQSFIYQSQEILESLINQRQD